MDSEKNTKGDHFEITDETGSALKKKAKLNDSNPKVTSQLDDEEEEKQVEKKHEPKNLPRTDSPYLGTIQRHMLDFDFEKLCSVTLSNLNVYACLVCGKYYQGRGRNTHAYFHSLEQDHHIFINLHNQKIYVLPDNYEVQNRTLDDIQFNLRPYYTDEEIQNLDKNTHYSRALDGTEYLPGCIGLNNLKATDYVNVVIQALCRVPDFRNFFMHYGNIKKEVTADSVNLVDLLPRRFAELVRKIWNPKSFKGHVSPHEFMQAISLKSNKRFTIIQQKDPLQLLAWLFDEFTKELTKTNKKKETIVQKCFQGELEFLKSDIVRDPETPDTRVQYNVERKPFMFLTLEIPPIPIYKDDKETRSIPQIPLFDLLKKFNGVHFTETKEGNRIKYKIKRLPKYLIFHMKRFIHNSFFLEKNPTIVNFPVNNLDLKDYVHLDDPNASTRYNLLANICHEGQPNLGIYKIYVRHKGLNEWFEIQDLHVTPVMPQQVAVSEAYVQIYERQD